MEVLFEEEQGKELFAKSKPENKFEDKKIILLYYQLLKM